LVVDSWLLIVDVDDNKQQTTLNYN